MFSLSRTFGRIHFRVGGARHACLDPEALESFGARWRFQSAELVHAFVWVLWATGQATVWHLLELFGLTIHAGQTSPAGNGAFR